MINSVQTVYCSVQCTRQRTVSVAISWVRWSGRNTPRCASGMGSYRALWRKLDSQNDRARPRRTTRQGAQCGSRSGRTVDDRRASRDAGTTRLRLRPPSGQRRADGRRHTPHAPPAAPACGVCTLKRPAQACADQHAPRRSRSQGIETCSAQSLHSSPRRPRPRRSHLCR